jgi:hypothetical protein
MGMIIDKQDAFIREILRIRLSQFSHRRHYIPKSLWNNSYAPFHEAMFNHLTKT